MPDLFHRRAGAALRDPTSWAAISALLFTALSQAPDEWARWCWIGAVVSALLGILLRGGGNAGRP